eukprot:scaffold4868_cov416-Prasinococcus_capsulatus_cf.AAC.27
MKSLTVECLKNATSPSPCTRHLKAPSYPEKSSVSYEQEALATIRPSYGFTRVSTDESLPCLAAVCGTQLAESLVVGTPRARRARTILPSWPARSASIRQTIKSIARQGLVLDDELHRP